MQPVNSGPMLPLVQRGSDFRGLPYVDAQQKLQIRPTCLIELPTMTEVFYTQSYSEIVTNHMYS